MVGLTRPIVDQIEAQGNEGETDVIVDNEKLKVIEPSEGLISEIAHGHFDPIHGILTLTMSNMEVFKVSGLPTVDNIPQGLRGPKGEPGDDGKPGKSGKDGETGVQGCPGPPGPVGTDGEIGQDGSVGPQGPEGHQGLKGETGDQGDRGDRGEQGPPGEKGPPGDLGPPGVPGPPGAGGIPNIIVSCSDPGPVGEGVLWVNPCASPPSNTTTPVPTEDPVPELRDPPIGTPWP